MFSRLGHFCCQQFTAHVDSYLLNFNNASHIATASLIGAYPVVFISFYDISHKQLKLKLKQKWL